MPSLLATNPLRSSLQAHRLVLVAFQLSRSPAKFACANGQANKTIRYARSASTGAAVNKADELAGNPVSHSAGSSRRKRIIVGITGATGSAISVRALQVLRELGVETHTILSKWGDMTLRYETEFSALDVKQMSTHFHGIRDLSAPISSGSFETDGMIIAPCSMKTLAATRIGFGEDLITRSADVCIKERRKLVLVVRETPLSDIHLENMLSLSRSGAIIFPPVPAFYHLPKSVDDIIDQTVGRVLDNFGIDTRGFERWAGFRGGVTRTTK